MTRTKGDNLQGALAVLVLKSLERGPMHGWGITLHIERISNEILRVEEGSLYPALHRLERQKLVAGSWHTTENSRQAKLYSITGAGKARLTELRRHWKSVAKGVKLVLRFKRS